MDLLHATSHLPLQWPETRVYARTLSSPSTYWDDCVSSIEGCCVGLKEATVDTQIDDQTDSQNESGNSMQLKSSNNVIELLKSTSIVGSLPA